MQSSSFLLATQKETPADAEIVSHQLMLRAGMVRKLASGLYTWLPLGLRVLRKVETIVREEMDRAGAQELLMPVVQPAELWRESRRWTQYGPELLRLQDRHERDFCLGPTHEEVITDLARNELRSYRQLPASFYQVQTKFRDEIRPRFGVMRAREFLMKDAYSFHMDEDCLDRTYQAMYAAYRRIFERVGLDYRAVLADTGSIGGSSSHEFHVLADSGEDAIVFSDGSDYAANMEMASALPEEPAAAGEGSPESVATPGRHSIAELSEFMQVEPRAILKTLIVHGPEDAEHPLVALVLRGDHELNEIKAAHHPLIGEPLRLAGEDEILAACGCGTGSLGPVGLGLPLLVDRAAAATGDFVCGANRDGWHLRGVAWGRDATATEVVDLRKVVAGDPSPDGTGRLQVRRGIEVGHIFKLGYKYSEAMGAQVLDEDGRMRALAMGCYGIGVSRVVAAAIEQNHDERGIIWPDAIAPFRVAVVPLMMKKSEAVREAAIALYESLSELGVDVLLDDRDERPGVKFADMELIGIPHLLVVGDRGLKDGEIEYRHRPSGSEDRFPVSEAVARLQERLG